MSIIVLLQILLIIIALAVTFIKDNLKMVIFFSVFSLISASLYYFYRAPDLALAEAAIGSAIIPLIFIISISKQREFIVITDLKNDDFLDVLPKEGKGYKLLSEFTDYYNLNLVITEDRENTIFGIFRLKNVDLFVRKNDDKYILEGKRTSIIMNKLAQMIDGYPEIDIVFIEEGETFD